MDVMYCMDTDSQAWRKQLDPTMNSWVLANYKYVGNARFVCTIAGALFVFLSAEQWATLQFGSQQLSMYVFSAAVLLGGIVMSVIFFNVFRHTADAWYIRNEFALINAMIVVLSIAVFGVTETPEEGALAQNDAVRMLIWCFGGALSVTYYFAVLMAMVILNVRASNLRLKGLSESALVEAHRDRARKLVKLLSGPLGYEAFMEHCAKEWCAENVLFITGDVHI